MTTLAPSGIDELILIFIKWSTDVFLLSRKDPSVWAKQGGSDRIGEWNAVFKLIYFLVAKEKSHPNINPCTSNID